MMKYMISVSAILLTIHLSVIIACGLILNNSDQYAKNFRTPVQLITGATGKEAEFVCTPGDYGRKFKFGRSNRFYEIHVPPSYDKSKPVPVVLVFHGGGGDPGTIRYESGMDRVADREGFIVVYPAGTNRRLLLKNRLLLWNDGRPYKDGSYSKVDDVGFVAALLDNIGTLFTIDTKRIYACGYSNGAQFSYRLAKRLSDRIAAIAAVAGHRPVNDSFDPPPSRPISVMQFSGLEDEIGPYYGGSPPFEAEFKTHLKPVKETIQSWVKFNKCPSEPAEVRRIGKAVMNRYGPCKGSTEVVFWTLEDGGHTWPGGEIVPRAEGLGLGNINRDIRASDLMWEFFKKHTLES